MDSPAGISRTIDSSVHLMARLSILTLLCRKLSGVVNLAKYATSRIAHFAEGLEPSDIHASKRARPYWDDIGNHTLSDLVHEIETRASGRVQVISLVDFRFSIGELWEKYKDRIVLIADSTISRMIERGSTYIAQDDDTWILLLPGLSESSAQELADSIATSIGDKLMGAKFTPHETPFPSTAKIDIGNTIGADGSVNVDALKAEVAKVRSAQNPASSVRKSISPSIPLTAQESSATSSPRMRTISTQLKTMLIPAWSADTECVDSFFFRAFTDANVGVFHNRTVRLNDADALDLMRTAFTTFHDMLNIGLRAKLTVPLPFDVLQSTALPHIQKMIAMLPQRERLLKLRLEVVQIPESIGAGSLVNIREVFRPYVRDIAFSIDPLNTNDQVLALDHILLGGELIRESVTGDDALFQALLHFRLRAGRRATYLLGLNNSTMINAALRAGIDELGGFGIAEAQGQPPERLATLSREDLLSQPSR